MVRSQILSIILFVVLAVAAVAAQVTLRWSGWVVVGVLFVGGVGIAGLMDAFGRRALGGGGGGAPMPVGPVGAVVERREAPLDGEMTVIAAARVRSRTDRQGVLGALWLLDAGGVVVALRDPLADALFAAGRFPAERVRWQRSAEGALLTIDADGERRAMAWDLEAPGAIEVRDGEVLTTTLEDALERATGLAVSGGRQVL